uniref:Uncharacterized protein n=1 Tax=Acrobeloides nanus TaxID=290746 RepID=A0A914CE20_9BILA
MGSDKGQCGVITNEPVRNFTLICLLPSTFICPHGLKCGDASNFSITDVTCTQSTVFILDNKAQIWSYGNGKIIRDKSGEKIEVIRVPFSKPVRQIASGRNHCIALVESITSNASEESKELTTSESTTSLNLKSCPQCVEDAQLRLSVFMREADKQADEDASVVTLETSPFETLLPDETSSTQSPSTSNLSSHLSRFKWHFPSMGMLKRSPESPGRKLAKTNPKKTNQPSTTWHTNSLPIDATPKSTRPRPRKGNSTEIELKTIPKKSSPTRINADLAGSIHFSFVCLDNVLSSDESCQSESDFGSKRPSLATSTTISESMSEDSKNTITSKTPTSETFYEVWTWGNNEFGQLGHADTISKKEPQKVKAINGPVMKISAGNDHNVVLMATGEAYVWGSNANGQFKQLNHQFITYPTPLKLGSESSLLDVHASGDTLSVIVTGHDESCQSESDFGSKRPSLATSTTISESMSEDSKNTITSKTSTPETFYEVWTWGNNEFGQLGHADTISKKEPQKVKAINGPVMKISAGNDHNVVLMATGEAYVWGSNANGQFKQLNHQFITYPTPLKLGSESSLLDVHASGDTLSVIVTGHGASPTAYHFSKNHSKIANSPTIHFSHIEKEGWPLNITSYEDGNSLLLGYMPKKDEETNYATLDAVKKVSKLLNSTKMVFQLADLSKKLHTQTDIPTSQNEVSILLNSLSQALNTWSTTVSRLSETCLNLLCTQGSIKLHGKSDFKIQQLVQSLLTLHFAYIEGVAYRCFSDVDIGNDLSTLIERLTLEYGTESSQQYRRLKNLFRLPFEHFNQLRETFTSVTVGFFSNFKKENFLKILFDG